jgi:DNA anti-recombination protein RmuC
MESPKIESPDFLNAEHAQKLKELLQDEEKRLGSLEKERIELVKELDKLGKEILKEKKKYRNLIDKKMSKEIDNIINKHPEQLQCDIKECTSAHQMRIDKIDLELATHLNGMNFTEFKAANYPNIPKTSTEEYLKSIKSFLSAKKSNKNSQ